MLLCLMGWGVPHPVMMGGYPIQSWWGVPHPVMMGRVPHPVMVGGTLGTPHPDLGWGTPLIQTWPGGIPQIPPIQTWERVPPTIQTWLGGTPCHSDLGWGTPPHPDLGWGPPDLGQGPPQTWDGVPPLEVWTDKQTENSTFPHPSDAGDKYMRL